MWTQSVMPSCDIQKICFEQHQMMRFWKLFLGKNIKNFQEKARPNPPGDKLYANYPINLLGTGKKHPLLIASS